MPTTIGEPDTLFNTAIPELTDVANIQNALRFYHYGNNGGVPATAASPAADSVYSHLKTLSDKFGTISPSTVLVASSDSKVVSSAISTTVLGYLSGVTSSIQTQIDSKAPIANPSFTGTVSGTFSGNLTGTASNATAVVHYKGTAGGDYSAVTPTNKIFTGQTQPTSGMTIGDIWMW